MPWLAGADAVIHLAWLIQPSRNGRELELERVNVDGSLRVFGAAAQAAVPALVHASSVGVYSPGPKDRAVDESWPREGVPSYSRHKVQAERMLDELEAMYPALRVVRLRPGLIFKREAGPEIPRLFAGPFLPTAVLRPGRADDGHSQGP
jgi:nucleoside-diphosphate-sugar epimerase